MGLNFIQGHHIMRVKPVPMQPPHLVPMLGDLLQVTLPIPSQLREKSRRASLGWGILQQEGWGCSRTPAGMLASLHCCQ